MSEVASAFVTLVPSAKGFKGKLESEIGGDLDRAGRDGGERYGNATKGAAAGILSKAGPLLAAAFTGAAAASLVSFVGSAIGSASDLNETINKANAIFGTNAAVVQRWAEGAATNLGLSKGAALDAAAGFGNMLTQLGFTGVEAASLSTEIVTLSADLGSFNNLPTADVADRISAAFRGEYDSLQLLIPNINAARVEQEALATTGKSVASELTAQEKAAAVLAIVHRDGALAAGDFAKTSDSLANQQKILKAKFEDVKAEIGQALLPVVERFMSFLLSTGIPALERLIQKVKDNKEEIKQFAANVASAALAISVGFLNLTATVLEQLAAQTRNLRQFVVFMIEFADGVLNAADAAFGWVPGVGEKIDTARGKLVELRGSAEGNLIKVEGAFQAAAGTARAAADAVAGVKTRVDALQSKTIGISADTRAAIGDVDALMRYINSRQGTVRVAGINSVGGITARASGGPLAAGQMSWVGEKGPELVQFAQPSYVHSNRDSTRMVGQSSDGTAAEVAALRGDVQSLVRDFTRSQRQMVGA